MKIPIVFIALYIALAGLLAVRVPLGKAPDESAHLYYVQHLAATHTLPVFKPEGGNKNPGYEFHQPPLYYAICALGWNTAGSGLQSYFCRLISVLFGAATIGLIWGAGRRVFDESVAAYAAGFAALWPLHVNAGAYAGNDTAAGFFCALLLYLMARGSTSEWPSAKLCAAMGAACGLAMLSKSSCLTVAAAAVGWTIHASLAGSGKADATAHRGRLLRNLALVLGVAAVVCGPWLARNNALYGDPLAAGTFTAAFKGASPGPGDFLAAHIPLATYIRALFAILFCSAWGAYGGPNNASDVVRPFGAGPVGEALPTFPLLLCCAAASVVALLGLVRARPLREVDGASRTSLVWWLAAGAAVLLAWINFNFSYYQAQARYLHPALLPMAILAACGWRAIFAGTRSGPFITAGFALVLLTLTYLNAFGWRTLL